MGFIKEFKAFAMRGNVLDLAVGVIIGGALQKIVSSLVNDILLPPIGVLLGGVSFKDLTVVLKAATEGAPAVTWNYGSFLQAIIDFVIIALAIFMLIRVINRLAQKDMLAAMPAEPTPTEALLTEIRDQLKTSRP